MKDQKRTLEQEEEKGKKLYFIYFFLVVSGLGTKVFMKEEMEGKEMKEKAGEDH